MRFRITGETDDEDSPEEILALCADAESYYVDPPPPARHRYELRGCAPRGLLASRAAEARETGSAPLGRLTLHALDAQGEAVEPVWDVWCLADVRLLEPRPGFADAALMDITVEAVLGGQGDGNEEQPEVPEVPPLFRGFRLSGEDDEWWGVCGQVALVAKEPEPYVAPLRLLGCEPSRRLLAALESGDDPFDLGGVYLAVLDRSGRAIDEHWTCLHVESWAPSPGGTGRVDLTLDVSCDDFRSSAAREVHELWWAGPPKDPNLWAPLGGFERGAWARATVNNRAARRTPDARPGATHHLDGRYVTDVTGFALALGEAVNGPGGYFGTCFGTIEYALGGQYGAQRPFTLVWHEHHIARACLGRGPLRYDAPSFPQILAFFAEQKIEVVLS